MSNNPYQYSTEQLAHKANEIRQDLVTMLVEAGSGHTGGPFGMADVFTAFYFRLLNYKVDDPTWDNRDRLILSNGHIVPVRYATMIHAGLIDEKHLTTLRSFGSPLQGHPHLQGMPAVETASGPLGEGLSQAVGMALAAKQRGEELDYHIYCLMSDGEHQEGMTWEAVMTAAKYRLTNLTGIIDRNNIQIDGYTEDIMPLEPLKDKYEAFGWHVLEMNGHSFSDIIDQVEEAKAIQQSPVLIIANTIPGKGIEYAENRYSWHGAPVGHGPEDEVPAGDQKERALARLRTMDGCIECPDWD